MRAWRLRGERGSATELVVVFPFVMFLLLLVIQFALWYHATHVAQSAAQEGARVARMAVAAGQPAESPAQLDAGIQRAKDFLAGMGAFDDKEVTGTRDRNRARIVVTGTAPSLVPGFTLTISEHSDGPVERFRAENDQ
jgi:TadE-like protein